MPLDAGQKQKIKYHLGYMNVAPAAAINFGVARPQQTLFLVEDAMSNLLEESVEKVLSLVTVLDRIECQMVAHQSYLAVQKIGELELRKSNKENTSIDLLENEYFRWAGRLADLLGVPFYAYSTRFNKAMRTGSIPVVS
jgi:hypothetical protein